ncbi:MAG: hypothetical protein QFF03_05540, partial [Pseudomonadota bacterium]|nr:hypothetical protein [Pseudomonadota bacterium]
MKTFIATLLATAVGASFAAAPTAALNHDPATYHNLTQKMTADYKVAIAKCAGMSGNAKTVCTEEAKAVRARSEADAIAQYNNTPVGRAKARTAVADADFALAKAKCGDMSGADKDACIANAASVHTAAVAEAKADHVVAGAAGPAAAMRDDAKAAAVDKCAQIAGQPKTGCLVDSRTAVTGTGTIAAGSAATVIDKTKDMAATVADKTRNTAAAVAAKTERATEKVEDKSAAATRKSGA